MATSNVSDVTMSTLIGEVAYGYRILFYLMRPSETQFKTLEEVPSYLTSTLRFIPMYLITEIVLLWLQRKRLPRWNDGLTSACCLMLIFIPIGVLGNVELHLYSWVHEHYRLVDLPWDSTITWVCGVIAADLGFYVWHRVAHELTLLRRGIFHEEDIDLMANDLEIQTGRGFTARDLSYKGVSEVNLIWAFHQVHHTPEDFNIFTGARLPTFNRQVAILFYLPGALFVPPSVFYVHYQLNYIFQFWIHTDAVPSLGPIELIINTPSLHRVHHGRNRYCIDKNYAAVFSIWDRMFGTYQEEKKGEQIFYGLVHPIRSWDVLNMQFYHLKGMFERTKEYDDVWDKLSVFFKGPGWYPGTPRLGLLTDIPVSPDEGDVYDKKLPLWTNIYCCLHLAATFLLFKTMKVVFVMHGSVWLWVFGAYLFWSVIQIGYLLEHKSWAPTHEIARSAAYFVLEFILGDAIIIQGMVGVMIRLLFMFTTFIWYMSGDMFHTKMDDKQHMMNGNGAVKFTDSNESKEPGKID